MMSVIQTVQVILIRTLTYKRPRKKWRSKVCRSSQSIFWPPYCRVLSAKTFIGLL